ncbi:GNAT family N-acetyltransferase [Spirillospora sp. NPDC047279]|uniref:GNAT family N-acetyltransferase n=1 Tax=Spirillospora sp. NPDC047279 TaxID=3155478 RepID=UPI0033E546CC
MTLIRFAGPGDVVAIEDVRSRSWRAAYAGLLPQELIDEATGPEAFERRLASFAGAPEARTLLAEAADGTPLGMAAFGPERDLPPHPDAVELYSLYVAPEHWSAKVGWALVERVMAESRKAGRDRVTLWVLESNARARGFYERAGFTAGEQRRHELWGHAFDEVRYEIAL